MADQIEHLDYDLNRTAYAEAIKRGESSPMTTYEAWLTAELRAVGIDDENCDCEARSWHGDEHDSACELAGLPMDWKPEALPREVERYTAEIDGHELTGEPCRCGDCDWKGEAQALRPIGDCGLNPGDASPAGRCPECDTLAYLDRPIDRATDALAALFRQGLPPKGLSAEDLAKRLQFERDQLAALEAAITEAWGVERAMVTIVAYPKAMLGR